jgi:2-oxoglutarate dehydrogenase E2 component (dihydrolipoamide succinyltransferase)
MPRSRRHWWKKHLFPVDDPVDDPFDKTNLVTDMEVKVPKMGESLTEATVLRWFKAVGDAVTADEILVELETDKVTLEIPAPGAGTLSEICAAEGVNVEVGALLGVIGNGAAATQAMSAPGPASVEPPTTAEAPAAPATTAEAPPSSTPSLSGTGNGPGNGHGNGPGNGPGNGTGLAALSPAVRKLVAEHALDVVVIPATGKDGRLTKGDVLAYLKSC